jgi:hypothetical protein
MSADHPDQPSGDQITPKLIDDVYRAFFDPMIGGWPLIHWEWIFCLDPASSGITVTGEWPASPDRRVTLHTSTGSRDLVEGISPDMDAAGE